MIKILPLNNNYNVCTQKSNCNSTAHISPSDTFVPNKPVQPELNGHEKIVEELTRFLFNTNKEPFWIEENLDQRKITTKLKELTGIEVKPVLDSEQIIGIFAEDYYTLEDIWSRLSDAFHKTIDTAICTNFNYSGFNETLDRINQERAENLYPIEEKHNNTMQNLEVLSMDFSDQHVKKKKSEFKKGVRNYLEQRENKEAAAKYFKNRIKKIRKYLEYDPDIQIPDQRQMKNFECRLGMLFENLAEKEVDRIIIPKIARELAAEEGNITPGEVQTQLRQIRNFKFYDARIEIDHLIIRVKSDLDEDIRTHQYFKKGKFDKPEAKPVEVVGIVETKHNPSRLEDGFFARIKNLEWLKGETTQDGVLFKQRYYLDKNTGFNYCFGPDSFNRFCTDIHSGKAYKNIYLVTTNIFLMNLEKQLLKNMDNLTLDNKQISENTNMSVKQILKKYKQHGQTENVIILNSYLNYTLAGLLCNFKNKEIIDKLKIPSFIYHYLR